MEVGISVLFISWCSEPRTQCLVQSGSSVNIVEWFHSLVTSGLSSRHSARNMELPNECSLNE